MDRQRVSPEFVLVIWIFVIRICFVLRISDLNHCVRGFAPLQRGFLRPSVHRQYPFPQGAGQNTGEGNRRESGVIKERLAALSACLRKRAHNNHTQDFILGDIPGVPGSDQPAVFNNRYAV